jgi:hypothetical protein
MREPGYETATAGSKPSAEVQRRMRELLTPAERAAARRRRLAELEEIVKADEQAANHRGHSDDAA